MYVFYAIMLVLLTGCCLDHPRAVVIDFPDAVLQKEAEDYPVGYLPNKWWTLFEDEQLSEFIETAFQNNPSLQEAHARVAEAAYAAKMVRSELFPQINWGGDILREKLSETGLIPFNQNSTQTGANAPLPTPAGNNGIPVYFTQYETEFTLQYDFDIWGKRRNAYLSALGTVKARLADDAFTRLELGIAIAKTYFQLQIDYRREEIAKSVVDTQVQLLELTKNLVHGNLNNGLTIATLEGGIADARRALIKIQADIAVAEHQLRAYLAGSFDETILKEKIAGRSLPAVPMPSDLPLHLLANRPDIRAQLWVIESAGKQIEVAKAGYYPDFNITALFGFQTIHLHKLFEYPKSAFWNFDPAFTLPIFDGGLLDANLGSSEVNYDIAIYQYNQLILNATKEVLDGLVLLRNSEEQLGQVEAKLASQEKYHDLTQGRFKNHLDSKLDVLQSEELLLAVKNQEAAAILNKLLALLSLIKALGGGYNVC
jgi:NodT family efflux transporter outer membrane factor (OMF) lipoprotein